MTRRTSNAFNPFDSFYLGLDMWRIGVESQAVIAMRTLGMIGLWSIRPQEMTRMVSEKPEAAFAAWQAASLAMMRGAGLEAVTRAALRPVGRRTGSNMRRLARMGPGICG
ncbi:antifreeze protein [Frigidibacter sp. MR17.14]|uniref:antifreeze protein n=1 Tax=Frigidibacter sp. MR17.14 TaxID=3126509 RepID=UPI003012FFAE